MALRTKRQHARLTGLDVQDKEDPSSDTPEIVAELPALRTQEKPSRVDDDSCATGTPGPTGAEESLLRSQMREAFDDLYYSARYLDVVYANVDPFEHYIDYGWKEDRAPRRDFDGAYYRKRHLDLGNGKMSPLEHYVRVGRELGLPTNEEDGFFREGDSEHSEAIFELLERSGMSAPGLDKDIFQRFVRPMFYPATYRATRGLSDDVSDNEALARYLAFDFANGVPPGPLFDDCVYREKARAAGLPSIRHSGGSFLHWIEHGIERKIVPNSVFSETEYKRRVSELDKSFLGWSFEHFLRVGQHQDLQFSPIYYIPRDKNNIPPRFESSRTKVFLTWLGDTPRALPEMESNRRFLESGRLAELTSEAAKLDPLIGSKLGRDFRLYPPWQDGDYLDFQKIRRLIPLDTAKRIILMPFGKMGGADYLASVLASYAGDPSDTLILRTEEPDWAYPSWFPRCVTTVDLSQELAKHSRGMRQRIIYELIRLLGAEHVYNCNSRVGFDTFASFGARLAIFTRLYAYFYCSDFDRDGSEAGYPVSHFSSVAPHVSAMLFDSAFWRDTLADRFALTTDLRSRMHAIYVPPKGEIAREPLVHKQLATAGSRKRPLILWAGRMDRQKRFDLVPEIARKMPHVDFACWGRPVLDPDEYKLDDLPDNVKIHPPFNSIEELPLGDADGWLYTSAWDGLPNIVIEVAARGLPIVASAVCGVPELIDMNTGWPVPDGEGADTYVRVLGEMLGDKSERLLRATAAHERVKSRHTSELFAAGIRLVEDGAND